MTREEKIKGLYSLKKYLVENPIELEGHKSLPITLIDYAIEALEQDLVIDKINKMKSEIADSLEFWDYSPNNNPLARDMLETLTNFWGDIKAETENP